MKKRSAKKKINIKKVTQLLFDTKVHDSSFLTTMKNNLNFNQQCEILKKSQNVQFRKLEQIIDHNPFPNNFSNLTKFPIPTAPAQNSYLQSNFLKHSILKHQDILTKFNHLREKLEESISLNNHQNALDTCLEIKNSYGCSFWLLDKLVQLSNNYDPAQKMVHKIEKEFKSNNGMVTNSFYIVLKKTASKEVDLTSLLSELNSSINLLKAEHSDGAAKIVHGFLMAYFFPVRFISDDHFKHALSIAETFSVIDKLIITDKYFKSSSIGIESSKLGNENTQYSNLYTSPFINTESSTSMDEDYFSFLSTIERSAKTILGHHPFLDFFELEMISLEIQNIPSYKENVLTKNAYIKELKEVSTDIQRLLNFFISNCFKFQNDRHLYCIALLSERFLFTDNFIPILTQGAQYSRIAPKEYHEIISRNEKLNDKTLLDSSEYKVPNAWKTLYSASVGFDQNNINNITKSFGETESKHPNVLLLDQLEVTLFWNLLECSKYIQAANLLLNIHSKNNTRFDFYPVKELINIFLKNGTNVKHTDFSASIIYYLHTKTQNLEFDTYTAYTFWDNFMRENKLLYPNEVLNDDVTPEALKKYTIMFLEHISCFDVLSRFLEYESNKDVYEARIRVLQELMRLNPPKTERYKKEIVKLTNEEVSIRLKRDIEQGQIYYNHSGLIKELFVSTKNNYLALKEIQKGRTATSLEASLHFFSHFKNIKTSKLNTIDDLFIFKIVFTNIHRAFLHSEKCGVNNYIGSRIRHNIFKSELLSILIKYQIVSVNNKQLESTYLEKLTGNTESKKIMKQLRTDIHRIYESIDEFIDSFTDQYLKVRGERNQFGVFSLHYTRDEIKQLMANSMSNSKNTHEFLEFIILDLKNKFESELSTVRVYYRNEFLPKFYNFVEDIFTALEKCSKGPTNSTRINTVKKKIFSLLKPKAEDITEWFYFEGEGIASAYRLIDIIDHSYSITKNSNPAKDFRLDLNLESEVEEIEIKGEKVKTLAMILNTLFDNVIKYSHGPNNVKEAKVSGLRVANSFAFTLENNAYPSHDELSKFQRTLDEIKKPAFKVEGGSSGLKRIYNDLMYTYGFKKNDIKAELKNNRFKFECTIEQGKVYGHFDNRRQ